VVEAALLEKGAASSSRLEPDRSSQPLGDKDDSHGPLLDALHEIARSLRTLNPGIVSSQAAVSAPDRTETFKSPRNYKRRRIDLEAHSVDGRDESLLGKRPCVVTRPELLEPLLTAFFNNVWPWFSVIRYADYHMDESDELTSPRNWNLLHAIVYAALRYVDLQGAALGPSYVEAEIRISRDTVVMNSSRELSVESVRALAIVVFVEVSKLRWILAIPPSSVMPC
jgi:hypothetical protein